MAEDKGPTGGQSLFWLVYGQIAAMLGAFSLLVFLTHFLDLGLKGVVREAFEGWATYVRPFFGYPLQMLTTLLPVELRFEVPEVAKDYVAVGFVTLFSLVRAGLSVYDEPIPFVYNRIQRVGLILSFLVGWPVAIPLYIRFLWGVLSIHEILLGWLAPLIYLGLLFAANAWLV